MLFSDFYTPGLGDHYNNFLGYRLVGCNILVPCCEIFCGCSWLPVAAICTGVGVEVGVGVGVEVDCGSKMQCTLSWLPLATNCIAKNKPGDRWKIVSVLKAVN